MPTLEEVHLGIGSGEVTFDYWPDLVDDLADYAHLIFYKLGKPFATVVILTRTPSPNGIVVGGYGLGFWQGVDKDGPIVFDRWYLAGSNLLSNGGFELLDALGDPLEWKRSESTTWQIVDSGQHSGTRAMVVGDLGKDDVLTSTEDREATGGDVFAGSMWGRRAAGSPIGRLRERFVFSGRFDPTNILPQPEDGAWTDLAVDGVATNGDVVDNTLRIGPIAQPQYITDPSFENGLADWVVGGDPDWSTISSLSTSYGTLSPRTGSLMAEVFVGSGAPTAPDRYLGPITGPGTVPGERYRLSGFVVERSFTRGTASLLIAANNLTTFPDTIQSVHLVAANFQNSAPPAFALQWRELQVEYTVPDGVISLVPYIYVSFDVQDDGTLAGTGFLFDDVTLTRIGGNLAEMASDPFPVTPERSYKLLANARSDVGISGSAWLRVRFTRSGAADVVVDLPTQQPTNGETHLISQSVTPPSGYDSCVVSAVGKDVLGGAFHFEDLSVSLDDTSTFVVDVVSSINTGGVWGSMAGTATAPAGTEKVHFELVAEQGATGWAVDDVAYHRVGPIATPESIVDDCFRDPDTGEYLVAPGEIHDLGALQWDVHVRNSTDREVFTTLLRKGLLDQPREWRHNPDNTVDVGLPDELFAVRDLTFVEEDLLLLDPPQLQLSVEDRIQRLLVYGAAKQARRAGLPDVVITGSATNDPGTAVDWFGNPVNRTRIIEDSSIDFQGYADARAREEADRNAHPAQIVNVGIAEWSAWDEFGVGDWVSVYKPEALIEDRTNPQTHKRTGRRIFPKLIRVLSRRLTMARGDGYQVKVRKLDGTIVDVSRYVRWDAKTKATLALGESRPDFANDPMGPAAGLQFLKHRVSGASAV